MRILVVDSSFESRFKFKHLLSAFGDCDTAADADAAFALFLNAHTESLPYRLLSIDESLSDSNGKQLVDKIRLWEEKNGIAKTEKEAKIIRVPSRAPESVGTRVLVVDDDYVSRSKLKVLLADYGDCDVAPDGKMALAMFIHAHQEEHPFGLVSMDINMPGMRGPEVVRKLREWEAQNGVEEAVRILMITGTEDSNDMLDSFTQGCEGYVQKPVIPRALRISLENIGIIPR